MLDALLSSIREDPLERLRWIVGRAVHAPPWVVRRLPDDEILRCGAHLVLDLRTAQAIPDRSDACESDSNPNFDAQIFMRRKQDPS